MAFRETLNERLVPCINLIEATLGISRMLLIEDSHAGRYFESGTFRMSVPYPSLDEVAEPQKV